MVMVTRTGIENPPAYFVTFPDLRKSPYLSHLSEVIPIVFVLTFLKFS